MAGKPRFLLHLIGLSAALACGGDKSPEASAATAATAAQVVNHDPCSLLTRDEAEAVLGSLSTAPFRSKQDSALADPNGPGCAYQTADRRALIITPEWTYGKMILDTERLVGGLVRQVADLPNGADTLEGTWDDIVVGLAGDLSLRKGARALTINYVNSSTDLAGAIKLSGPALTRLAAVPEPERPAVSSDGCPLAPDAVTGILGMSVRLAPRPVRLMDACSYQLIEDPTVEVELSIKPANVAEMLFEGMHARVKGLLGSTARADSIGFGDEGWAYGSGSSSEAAVRKGEQLYHAAMSYPLSTSTGNLKNEMVRLVAAMMARSE